MDAKLREAEANLRAVAGVSDIQVVGALSEEVVQLLGITCSARSVWLHHHTVTDIYVGRGLTTSDASFVMEHLSQTVLHPHYCGPDPSNARRVAVVREVEKGRFVCVPLKIVSAAAAESNTDEIWVSTAYPLNERFLTRRRWRGKLHRVTGTE